MSGRRSRWHALAPTLRQGLTPVFLRGALLLSWLLTLAACSDDGGGSASDASTGNATPASTGTSTGDAPTSIGMTSEPATTEPATSTTGPT